MAILPEPVTFPPLPPHGFPSHLFLFTNLFLLLPLHIAMFPLNDILPRNPHPIALLPLLLVSVTYLIIITLLYFRSNLSLPGAVACNVIFAVAWAASGAVLTVSSEEAAKKVGIVGCVLAGCWMLSATGCAGVWWRLRGQKKEEQQEEEDPEKRRRKPQMRQQEEIAPERQLKPSASWSSEETKRGDEQMENVVVV